MICGIFVQTKQKVDNLFRIIKVNTKKTRNTAPNSEMTSSNKKASQIV